MRRLSSGKAVEKVLVTFGGVWKTCGEDVWKCGKGEVINN